MKMKQQKSREEETERETETQADRQTDLRRRRTAKSSDERAMTTMGQCADHTAAVSHQGGEESR